VSGRRANYEVEHRGRGLVVIRDHGPWDEHLTVTNDAEGVVARLSSDGLLRDGDLLLYYDSDGDLSQLLHLGGEFVGFEPAPFNRRNS
jgi:hypothetical protein